MSQTELGAHLGITFQQIQKYEARSNRIGSGRLQRIAEALDMPVGFFFSGDQQSEEPGESPLDYLKLEGAVKLVRAYSRITDGEVRRAAVHVLEYMADAETPPRRGKSRK
jgi:transcriptional regulator with XRE-family HTH domain